MNSLFTDLSIETVTSVDISPSDPAAGESTNYDIIFTADTDIPKESYIVITLPPDITVSTVNAGGSTVLDTCANLFDSSVTLTCTVGTDADGNTTIKVEGLFPENDNSGQFGIDLGLLLNPSTTGETGDFQIDIFSPNDDAIASETEGGDSNSVDIKTPVDDAS